MDESYYRSLEPFWGSWHIVKKIGEGSYGQIFEIEREEFGNKYSSALKIITIPHSEEEWENIRSEGMDENATREYFLGMVREIVDETVLMSELRGHSNIVSYEDHTVKEHANGHGWDILIRMELLTPFVRYFKDRIATREEILKIGIDICNALEICQKRNIIHRDIKQENILVGKFDNFKLGDFGVSKITEKNRDVTTAKQGTPNYMAPEVYKGESYNSTVDIYSLGCLLYRLANKNRHIFYPAYPQSVTYGDKEVALKRRVSGEKIPYPVDAQDELGQVILKACAYHPADRYQSAAEFHTALERIQAKMKFMQEPISEHPAPQVTSTVADPVVDIPEQPVINETSTDSNVEIRDVKGLIGGMLTDERAEPEEELKPEENQKETNGINTYVMACVTIFSAVILGIKCIFSSGSKNLLENILSNFPLILGAVLPICILIILKHKNQIPWRKMPRVTLVLLGIFVVVSLGVIVWRIFVSMDVMDKALAVFSGGIIVFLIILLVKIHRSDDSELH